MFDEDQLREMSHPARHELMRVLAAIENADPAAHDTSPRRRALVLAMIVVCCVVLAAWIGVLVVTLPRTYRSGGWRGAWVGFDVALLAAFAVTGWAAWRRRQVLIICLVVLATLLCCDAWFDVVLDAGTSGFGLSVLSAVCIELPLAGLAILGARRLLRLSLAVIRRYEGETGEIPGLRQAKIVGGSPGSSLSDLFTEGDARGAGRGAARSAARASERGGSWPRPAADHGDRAGPSLEAASDHGDAGEVPHQHDAAELPAASREAGQSPAASSEAGESQAARGGADGGGADGSGAEHGEADGGGAAGGGAGEEVAAARSALRHPDFGHGGLDRAPSSAHGPSRRARDGRAASGHAAPDHAASGHGGSGHRSASPGLYRALPEPEIPARAADEPD